MGTIPLFFWFPDKKKWPFHDIFLTYCCRDAPLLDVYTKTWLLSVFFCWFCIISGFKFHIARHYWPIVTCFLSIYTWSLFSFFRFVFVEGNGTENKSYEMRKKKIYIYMYNCKTIVMRVILAEDTQKNTKKIPTVTYYEEN